MQDSRPHLLKCKKAAKPPSMQSLQPPPPAHRPRQNCCSHRNQDVHLLLADHGPTPPPCCVPVNITSTPMALAGNLHGSETMPHERRQSKQSWQQPPTHGSSSPKPASCQCVDGPVQPPAPKMKSRLTVEAAGADSLCCSHDTLNGPFWHGPS